MTTRPTKTADELNEMIRKEIRKHPECNRIEGVRVLRKVTCIRSPNWEPMWIGKDARTPPAIAWDIARKIQSQFDLS